MQLSVVLRKPSDLAEFLSGFRHTAPALTGDPVAMERVALEFCEDAAANGLVYVESRFCPHLIVDSSPKEGAATADDILEAVLRGFARGRDEYGVHVETLLCCIRGLAAFDRDILRLCEKYRGRGVVGIDIAGDEGHLNPTDKFMFDAGVVTVFDEARKLGIQRTVHAGEAGPAKCVQQALDIMHANRIGHGYHVLEDAALYARCLKERVHFETCPTSSILTGAQPTDVFYHATVRFAEDGANFSINSDDPMVTSTWTEQEYELVRSWGLSETHIVRSNVNAISSSFLPPAEKKAMLRKLFDVYHIQLE